MQTEMMNRMSAFGLVAILGFAFTGCALSPDRGSINLALVEASRLGDASQVSRLLAKGADINATDPDGWTPYLAASAEGNWKVMKLLQDKGCKTDPGF
jgi:ankyrin repeat protein